MSRNDVASHNLPPLVRAAAERHDETIIGLIGEGEPLTPDAVHEIRVAIKNLRALWRLVAALEKGAGEKAAKGHYRDLKRAAAALSGSRDSQVMLETLDELAAASHRDYESEALAAVRERLGARASAETHPQPPAAFVTVFQADLQAWRALTLKGDDRTLIRAGLGELYKQARQRGLEAAAGDQPEPWHRFRKWAKYLLYQLTPLIVDSEDLPLRDLKKLGKALGRLHDLHMLDEHLKRLGKKDDGDREAAMTVRQLIARREMALCDDCEKRTRRFFSLKPKAFRRTLERTLSAT